MHPHPSWLTESIFTGRACHLHWVSGIVAVAWAWRLDSDTFSDLRNGSCDRPLTWLSLVLTDDRHATSSCQLTSGRAKSPRLILTARGRWKWRKKHEEKRRTTAYIYKHIYGTQLSMLVSQPVQHQGPGTDSPKCNAAIRNGSNYTCFPCWGMSKSFFFLCGIYDVGLQV